MKISGRAVGYAMLEEYQFLILNAERRNKNRMDEMIWNGKEFESSVSIRVYISCPSVVGKPRLVVLT